MLIGNHWNIGITICYLVITYPEFCIVLWQQPWGSVYWKFIGGEEATLLFLKSGFQASFPCSGVIRTIHWIVSVTVLVLHIHQIADSQREYCPVMLWAHVRRTSTLQKHNTYSFCCHWFINIPHICLMSEHFNEFDQSPIATFSICLSNVWRPLKLQRNTSLPIYFKKLW